MQKLVKRRMHYQAIVPVEAYDDEKKKDSEDTINQILLIGSCIWAVALPDPVGDLFCIAGIANTLAHDEDFVDSMTYALETYGDAELTRMEAQTQAAEATIDVGADVYNGIVDGINSASDDYSGDHIPPPHPSEMDALTGGVLH